MKRVGDRVESLIGTLQKVFDMVYEDIGKKEVDELTGETIQQPNYRAVSAIVQLARVLRQLYALLHKLRKEEGTVAEDDERFAYLKEMGDRIHEAQQRILEQRGSRQTEEKSEVNAGTTEKAKYSVKDDHME